MILTYKFFVEKLNEKIKSYADFCYELLGIASNKNALVFDPFMGVTSTAIAALKTGRRFCGCEIIKEYYQAGVDRVKKFIVENDC